MQSSQQGKKSEKNLVKKMFSLFIEWSTCVCVCVCNGLFRRSWRMKAY